MARRERPDENRDHRWPTLPIDDILGRDDIGRREFLRRAAATGVLTLLGTSIPAARTQAAPRQELVIVQGADPETLDPQGTTTRSTLNVSGAICDPLAKVRFADSGAPSVVPVLAASWKLLDETTWQFKLREDVRFTNGEAFDAGVAKFSLERLMDRSNRWPSFQYVSQIKSVTAVDRYTINIMTPGPYPLLPWDLTMTYMVPPKYVADVGKEGFANRPMGTGPFKFVEWVKDDHITLEANPDYWGGRPNVTRIVFRPIPEASTRTAAVASGQADVVIPMGITDTAALKGRADIRIENVPSLRIMYVVLDQASNAIMRDLRVRQALNYAVDKDAIIKHIFQGYATKLQGQGLAPQYFGFNPALSAYPYDPDRAKKLLADAGYKGGFSATLWTSRGRYPLDYETAQAVAGQLADIGVNVTVNPLEWAVYIRNFTEKKLSPMLLAAWAVYPDADRMFEAFRTGGVYSYTNLPVFDKTLEDERSLLDEKKRLALLQRAARLQHNHAVAIFLHQLQSIYAVNRRVRGFKLLPNEAMELQGISHT